MKYNVLIFSFLMAFVLPLQAGMIDAKDINPEDGSAVATLYKFVKGANIEDESVLTHLSDDFLKKIKVLYGGNLNKYLQYFKGYDLNARFAFKVSVKGDEARITLSSQKKDSGKRAGYTFKCKKIDGIWKIDG